MTFEGRTYIVTGAARGIGLATARALLEEGAGVVLVDRDAGELDAKAIELKALGPPVSGVAVDVTDPGAIDQLVADLAPTGIDGLVNAAGVLQLGDVSDVTPDDWDRVVGVNLKGTFLMCRAVIGYLERENRSGAIVNMASISGRTKSIYSAPNYVASKGGVIGLTMVLAAQNAQRNIRVNCVAPGVIDTPMTSVYTDEQWTSILDQIPMKRIGDASEVANVIVTLLSDRWSYVTGQTINVNGGQFMQ